MSTENTQPEETQNDEEKLYTADYVKALRQESAKHRVQKQEYKEKLEELQVKHMKEIEKMGTKEQNDKELVAELQHKIEQLEAKSAEGAKAIEQLNTYKEERKKTLLEKLPEDKREKYAGFDVSALEVVIDDVVRSPQPSIGASGKPKQGGDVPQDFSKMTLQEQTEYLRTNPQEAYKAFANAMIPKKP